MTTRTSSGQPAGDERPAGDAAEETPPAKAARPFKWLGLTVAGGLATIIAGAVVTGWSWAQDQWREFHREPRISAIVYSPEKEAISFALPPRRHLRPRPPPPARRTGAVLRHREGLGLGDPYTDLGEGYDSYELRTFGTDGAPPSAVPGLGRPDGEILDPYSPSGRRLAGWCPDRPRELCVHDAATGAALVRIETSMRYPIRWYDEDHLLVWRRHGEGHAASVMDIHGRILTDLARGGSAGRDGMRLFYTPRPR